MPELSWTVEAAPSAPANVDPPAVVGGEVLTWRDTLLAKSPPWLQRGLGGKLLYVLGLHMDALGDAAVAAVRLRFPGVYTAEALPYQGRDRRIRRGRTEPDANYAVRLRRWRDDHRRRGGPFAMLSQLYAHYAPNNFPISLVYRSGRRFAMDTAGVITVSDMSWNPDALPDQWARWWLLYSWPEPVPAVNEFGGGWSWGGGVWGAGFTPDEIADLRLVPKEWNAAHAQGRIVLLGPGTQLWGFPPRLWGEGTWDSGSRAELTVK